MRSQTCRACGAPLTTVFADLGQSPISNAYPLADSDRREVLYPLLTLVCDECLLVQAGDVVAREEHFNADYAYFSSFSDSWLAHARRFADEAIARFGLGADSRVVEVASNDGYLLRHFVASGIPSLGIDPAANCAAAALAHGVETRVAFFGRALGEQLAGEGQAADLIAANNVLAHVPDINDFVAGFAALLKPGGTASFEFPHLLELIRHTEFDTIYHEHYSYLSLAALDRLFARHGLAAWDVEKLPTHGGSLRLFVARIDGGREPSPALLAARDEEAAAGLTQLATYRAFGEKVVKRKLELLKLLIPLRENGATICGYGAPAKAATLLNYCGIGAEMIAFTVDRNPQKQGRMVPGTGIPVLSPDAISERRPDYVVILPWNLNAEIVEQLGFIRQWGGRFILLAPDLKIA